MRETYLTQSNVSVLWVSLVFPQYLVIPFKENELKKAKKYVGRIINTLIQGSLRKLPFVHSTYNWLRSQGSENLCTKSSK